MGDRQQVAWQISLRGMLVAVALLALASVALKFANEWWGLAAFTVVSFTLGVAALLAILERGPRQAFAIGFTVWGLTHCILASDNSVSGNYLPTRAASLWVYDQLAVNYEYEYSTGTILGRSSKEPEETYRTGLDGWVEVPSMIPPPPSRVTSTVMQVQLPSSSAFFAVFDSLWTLLFAYLGGKLAVWIYHRRVSRECDNAKGLSDGA